MPPLGINEFVVNLPRHLDINILMQRALFTLTCNDIVALIGEDRLGDIALTTGGVDCDDRILDVKFLEKFGDCRDFV